MSSAGANTWSVPLEINNLEAQISQVGAGAVQSVSVGNANLTLSGTAQNPILSGTLTALTSNVATSNFALSGNTGGNPSVVLTGAEEFRVITSDLTPHILVSGGVSGGVQLGLPSGYGGYKVTAPTVTPSTTSDTQVATTAFVQSAFGITPATNVNITNDDTNFNFYPTFVAGTTSQPLLIDKTTTGFTYNPNTNAVNIARTLGVDGVGGTGKVRVGASAGIGQGNNAVAVGASAGLDTQGASAVAVGNLAGYNLQGANATAVGVEAGEESQGASCVAVGQNAGNQSQGQASIAIGLNAGLTSQGLSCVAIGASAGLTSQGNNSVAIGNQSGLTQGASSVAIGVSCGNTSQGASCVAVGQNAGQTTQTTRAVAIGANAGLNLQGNGAISIGYDAGRGVVSGQGADAVAIGRNAGRGTTTASQGSEAIAIGVNAGENNQGVSAVAIGVSAGITNQSADAIAIGDNAGNTAQGVRSVGIGLQAGFNTQGADSVAIGYIAGRDNQSANAVAVGKEAGYDTQGASATAVGNLAGKTTQGANAVAVGHLAGNNNQGTNAIAIGHNAGRGTTSGQGANAIAIGHNVGTASQVAGSICINASGVALNPAAAACYIRPLVARAAAIAVYYNTTTYELTYLSSSATTKNTIEELKEDTSVLYGLSPKTYLYNTDPEAGQQIGYIAEEVAGVHKKFATYNEPNGDPVAIDYNTIVVFLVEEMKKLRERVAQLESR